MKLPNKFQMRVSSIPGFTHTVTKNANGDYEVNWARGYPNKIGSLPIRTFDEWDVDRAVESGAWIVVEETPKQDNVKLPDEFYFQVDGQGEVYHMLADRDGYKCTDTWGNSAWHSHTYVVGAVKEGAWRILDKKPLTAEQQRSLKSFQEQVAQLDSSIKLNEQTIEHHERLISNYKSRQDDLRDKIAEIMGEELPSVTKAKALKAELGKLKGNV